MIRPSSEGEKKHTHTDSADRPEAGGRRDTARHGKLSADERRKKFEEGLVDTMEKYDWALRKLAE